MKKEEQEIVKEFNALLKRFDKFTSKALGEKALTDEEWKMLERGVCPDCLQKDGEHLHDCKIKYKIVTVPLED